jgi:hypothetical protein
MYLGRNLRYSVDTNLFDEVLYNIHQRFKKVFDSSSLLDEGIDLHKNIVPSIEWIAKKELTRFKKKVAS